MSKSGFHQPEVKETAPALRFADCVSENTLNLGYKNLTDLDIPDVLLLLHHDPRIQFVLLHDNDLGPDGILHFARHNKKALYVDLSENPRLQGKDILEYLKRDQTVKTVVAMGCSNLNDREIKAFLRTGKMTRVICFSKQSNNHMKRYPLTPEQADLLRHNRSVVGHFSYEKNKKITSSAILSFLIAFLSENANNPLKYSFLSLINQLLAFVGNHREYTYNALGLKFDMPLSSHQKHHYPSLWSTQQEESMAERFSHSSVCKSLLGEEQKNMPLVPKKTMALPRIHLSHLFEEQKGSFAALRGNRSTLWRLFHRKRSPIMPVEVPELTPLSAPTPPSSITPLSSAPSPSEAASPTPSSTSSTSSTRSLPFRGMGLGG